jgi:hypothetical protein
VQEKPVQSVNLVTGVLAKYENFARIAGHTSLDSGAGRRGIA